MDREQLRIRAERRKRLIQAQEGQDSLVAEIGRYWFSQVVPQWDPASGDKIPAGVPVGEEFKAFVKKYMKSNGFRALEFGDGFIDVSAEAVANWIDFSGQHEVGRDYPNPLSEVDKDKGEGGYVSKAASFEKEAIHAYDSQEEDRHRTLYGPPEEWTRHSPDNPGVMLQRISDGVYQDPVSGQTYQYHVGVHNQTNPNWNDTWPQPAFLSFPTQQSTRAGGGTYEKIETEGLRGPSALTADEEHISVHPTYGDKEDDTAFVKETSELYAKKGVKGFMKKAQQNQEYGIADNLFGKTTLHSRYCPDHEGVSLYRLADSVFQCPLDRAVYDYGKGFKTQDGEEHNGGSVADMTPDWPEFYQSPHPFVAVQKASGVKGMMKRAFTNLEYRLARDMDRALRGDEDAARVLGLISDGVFNKGKALMESVRDAYEYMEQSAVAPAEVPQPAIEVGEEELDSAELPVGSM